MTPSELYEQNQMLAPFVINTRFRWYINDEDVLQVARLGLWNACRTYCDKLSEFSTYACCCIEHEIQKIHQARTRLRQIPDEAIVKIEDMTNEKGEQCDMEWWAVNDDYIDFSGFVEALDDVDREVVKLRLMGYTRDEVGDALGVTGSRVGQRLKQIRKVFSVYI